MRLVPALAAILAAITSALGAQPALRPAPGIQVPAAFRAETYATGLRQPTALAFGPGRLLFATQETGEVVAVGRGSTKPRIVARGFRTPLGLAWIGRRAFVSTQGALFRTSLSGRRLAGTRAIVSGLAYGRHQQNNVVAIGRRLYFGSGSTCDVCVERDRRSAAVLSVRDDGSDLRVEATGLRNPFGLARTGSARGDLFVSVNNRDDLGTWEPAETIVVLRPGVRRRFGWPGCWPSWRERRLKGSCAGVTKPFAYLEPHSSANGLVVWRKELFVAEWGQYASRRFGRKVVRVDARGRVRTFATGFEHPLAVAVEPHGDGLLVADWARGTITRIRPR